jgi:hypothetical protein
MEIIKRVSTTLLVVVLSNPLISMAGNQGKGFGRQSQVANTLLDAKEIQNLVYLREEEKLARDVYRTLFGIWGLPVLDNISESEQVHATQVEDMLHKYRVVDPVVDDATGVFVDQELGVLYDMWVAEGSRSLLKALYVAAAIEEIDMIDLRRAIEQTDNSDIQRLYENLMSGSRNHLRAYVRQIENRGIVYQAQYLPQYELDSIVDSNTERSGSHAG